MFLLGGGSAVFVWVGKGASPDERKKSMTWAADYLTQHGRPDWTPITRLPAGGETPQFKQYFKQFDAELAPANEPEYVKRERKIEMAGLLDKQRRADEALIEHATGEVDIWRVENLKRVAIDRAQFGQFYSGDSYVILYKYRLKNRDAAILYFWQVRMQTHTAMRRMAVPLIATIRLDHSAHSASFLPLLLLSPLLSLSLFRVATRRLTRRLRLLC